MPAIQPTPKAEKAFKFPTAMGQCADLLHAIRERRQAAQKMADAIEAEEKALKEHIINNLPKGDSGAAGKFYRVQTGIKLVPTVKDWPAFYEFVRKNKRFDMLQKRLSEGAITELWDAGKKVPGVEPFQAVTVSLTKLK